MGVRYKTLERELYYTIKDDGYIVKIYTGKELYSKLKKNSRNQRVHYGDSDFSFDILKSSSCSEDFFFISPIDNSVIVRCYDYDDTWYSLCAGAVKVSTFRVVEECLNSLHKAGFGDDSLAVFLKKKDGYFHLNIDGKDYGYLGNDDNDAEYKKMLMLVFKDIKSKVEVVVLPSKGSKMFFSENVAIYKTRRDFCRAIASRNSESLSEVALSVINSTEDNIE